ncbi:MAG: heparinase II/III family protein, partial [Verrucomicrobiales bacterium]|nr:heparinase II/III family protein [Verrucomicrobiales bacterium]
VEVRDLALAYDAVFDALARDAEMVEFLAVKAARFKPPLPKNSFADIQRNIEERIFRDTLANRPKIESNYPATDTTVLILHTVLGWPANRPQVLSLLDAMLEKATAVDGLTGEKGLTGYSAIAPREIAELLGRYARTDPAFLPEVLRRHPRLHAMYRFHLDTRCLDAYYPRTGDTGAFATKNPAYPAVHFTRNPGIQPSAFAFLAELAHATGDLDFVRLLYEANGKSVDGLPWDLFADDPGRFQSNVLAVIREHGAEIRLSSVNKTQWALAILRAGEGPHARAAWLDYDSGERHGHADGLTLGLFAKGLDLLPDFGYPPVQFGGWLSPRARWYSQTPAHNTVSVDGQDTRTGTGRTTLWFDGDQLRAVRASAPALIAGSQFERTLLMVDLSPADSYLVDIFRVAGGREHTRFFHGHFGTLKPERLAPQPVTETRYGELMRNFRRDPQPAPGWSVTWLAHDQLQYLPPGRQVRLRLTDLTRDAEVDLAESWVSVGLYDSTADTWIPSVLVRRRSQTPPLSSTFAGVLEPFEGEPLLRNIRRLRPTDPNGNERPDSDVALEVELADGRRDLILALDTERRAAAAGDVVVALGGRDIRLRGELCLVRFNTAQAPERLVLCRGQTLRAGEVTLQLKDPAASVEVDLTPPDAPRIRGETGALESLEIAGRRVLPK